MSYERTAAQIAWTDPTARAIARLAYGFITMPRATQLEVLMSPGGMLMVRRPGAHADRPDWQLIGTYSGDVSLRQLIEDMGAALAEIPPKD